MNKRDFFPAGIHTLHGTVRYIGKLSNRYKVVLSHWVTSRRIIVSDSRLSALFINPSVISPSATSGGIPRLAQYQSASSGIVPMVAPCVHRTSLARISRIGLL